MTTETQTYRIVKRAFSVYTDIKTVDGWLNAMTESMAMQFANQDGEYMVKQIDEPNWVGGPAYQSPMDWL
jgi:secreted trypsin-like serine protease